MLVRDMIRFKRKGDRIEPAFADPASARVLELASELCTLYGEAPGSRRGEIEELVEPQLKSAPDQVLAASFNKILLDHCDFEAPREIAYPTSRQPLFELAGRLLGEGLPVEDYRARLRAEAPDAAFFDADWYGDLPENSRLIAFKALTARELVERYNLALVQSLLLYAKTLDIVLAAPEPVELRRFFKYLKFFRLLAEARREKEGAIRFTISGPFDIFENSRKYALQLASFFPAAVLLKEYRLEAVIRWKDKDCRLLLDQSSGLKSHYRSFSDYVPEEIAMFHRLFREKVEDWKIVGETAMLEGGGGRLFFPDLSFRHRDGKPTVHLELFHRWHRGDLGERLELLRRKPKTPLVIGIDRALADDAAFAALEAKYPTLAGRFFRFRDFPGVDRVRRALENFR